MLFAVKSLLYIVLFIILTIVIMAIILLCMLIFSKFRIKIIFSYEELSLDSSLVISSGFIKINYQLAQSDSNENLLVYKTNKKFFPDIIIKKSWLNKNKKETRDKEIKNKNFIIKGIKKIIFKVYESFDIKKVKFEKLDITITEGLDEASHTAIISGILYSVWGILFSVLSNILTIFNVSFSVVPDFNKKVFNGKLLCIFYIRPANIITRKQTANRFATHRFNKCKRKNL